MADIEDFVREWNYRFPVDYWWRKKHGIAFNSPEHRKSNFWTQMFEWYEDQMYKSFQHESDYKPNEMDFLNIVEKTIERVEDGISIAMEELRKFKEAHGHREGNKD